MAQLSYTKTHSVKCPTQHINRWMLSQEYTRSANTVRRKIRRGIDQDEGGIEVGGSNQVKMVNQAEIKTEER